MLGQIKIHTYCCMTMELLWHKTKIPDGFWTDNLDRICQKNFICPNQNFKT